MHFKHVQSNTKITANLYRKISTKTALFQHQKNVMIFTQKTKLHTFKFIFAGTVHPQPSPSFPAAPPSSTASSPDLANLRWRNKLVASSSSNPLYAHCSFCAVRWTTFLWGRGGSRGRRSCDWRTWTLWGWIVRRGGVPGRLQEWPPAGFCARPLLSVNLC